MSLPAATLARFAPVGLDELTATAALLTRVDRKYVLDVADADTAVSLLPGDTRVLDIDGDRQFAYRSVYFDTGDLDSYHRTAQRRRLRFKVRTRRYTDGSGYLEVKTRRGQQTVKERIPYGYESLDDAGVAYITDRLDSARIDLHGRLRPTLLTGYTRATLLSADGTYRVTVDTDLAWATADHTATLVPDGLAIIETKSPSRPSDIDRLLWSLGHRPQPVSKYATGLAALRPDLPRNRWHRLLVDRLDQGAA